MSKAIGQPERLSAPRSAPAMLAWAFLVLIAAAGCGEEKASGSSDTGAATDTTTTTGGGVDTGEEAKPSCIGVAEEQVALYSQYDDECAFLSDCEASGKCWCGAGCNAGTKLCADSICADIDADCSCGESCAKDGSVTICPNVICKPLALPGLDLRADPFHTHLDLCPPPPRYR